MKKEYKDLELETVNFAAEDVITASGDPLCEKDCKPYRIPCPFEFCECNRAHGCPYEPSM